MRISQLLHHPLPLTILYWLTSTLHPIKTHQFFTNHSRPLLILDLVFLQILFSYLFSHLYLLTTSPTSPTTVSTPPNTRHTLPIALLHYAVLLLTNLSILQIGALETLLWRFLQPLFITLLSAFLKHPSSQLSLLGVFLTVLGVYHFSSTHHTPFLYLPILLATFLISVRDTLINLTTPTQPANETPKPHTHATTTMQNFNHFLHNALPISLLPLLWRLSLHGFQIHTVLPFLQISSLLACYHVTAIALISQLDTFSHASLATLKRLAVLLFAAVQLKIQMTQTRLEGLAVVICGFVMYLFGRSRQRFGVAQILLAFFSGGIVLAVFGLAGGFERAVLTRGDPGGGNMEPVAVNVSMGVERVDGDVDSGGFMIIPMHDYRSVRRSGSYAGYKDAISHNAGNVGNLVWKYAAHESLVDFGGATMCRSQDSSECVARARNRGLSPLIFKPVANLLNPDSQNIFSGASRAIRAEGLTVLNVGLGVQVSFRSHSTSPQFNSSIEITTSSRDYVHPENTKDYLRAMSESGGEMLLRGDFSLNITRAGGFTRGHSLGCPSLFMNEDVHLGRTLENKYNAISERQRDRSLKIAVNLKGECGGMEKQLIHFRDNYPNSRFYAQGPGDMRVLSRLNVPYERTRMFLNVEDWIEDLKEMDVSYGLRIHGNMISVAAGLPVLVAAPDWRVLELVQRMQIPYLTTYDPIFEEDVDIAKIIGKMERFNGGKFDRNRCEIAKVYISVFQRYGIGVRKHVRDISRLC